MITNKASDAGIFLWMVYQTMQKMDLDAANIFASVHLPDQPPDKSVRRDNSTQRYRTSCRKKCTSISRSSHRISFS